MPPKRAVCEPWGACGFARPFLVFLLGALVAVLAVGFYGARLPLIPQEWQNDTASETMPPPGVGEQSEKLGTPSWEALNASGSYAFIGQHPDGTAVTYSPCRPIHYVLSSSFLPEDGREQVRAALEVISDHSGFQFVFDGFTDERPTPGREAYQPDRYPGRWAPVLIGWVDAGYLDGFRGETIGEATSTIVYPVDSPAMAVSGQVGLSVETWQDASRGLRESLLLHEFAHLVGLAHVSDDSQALFPYLPEDGIPLGAGDKAGLAALHQSPCSAAV